MPDGEAPLTSAHGPWQGSPLSKLPHKGHILACCRKRRHASRHCGHSPAESLPPCQKRPQKVQLFLWGNKCSTNPCPTEYKTEVNGFLSMDIELSICYHNPATASVFSIKKPYTPALNHTFRTLPRQPAQTRLACGTQKILLTAASFRT